MSRALPAASNAVVSTVVNFTPEPRGYRQAFAMLTQTAAELNGIRAVMATAGQTYYGYTRTRQSMTGQASAVAAGRARVIAPRSSELSKESGSAANSGVSAVFRERMARGRA